MSDKAIGCTQFTDRECREEDCCLISKDYYIAKNTSKVIFSNLSESTAWSKPSEK